MKKELPPLAYLQAIFSFDVETGDLRWNRRPLEHFVAARACRVWNTRYAGKVAGSRYDDGIYIIIDRQRFAAHRIAYKIHHGVEPPPIIDHRDVDPLNNQPGNLRAATTAQNLQNIGKRSNNTTGFKGVSVDKRCGKYVAQICVSGKKITVARSHSASEAAKAYAMAAARLHGEFARVS